jgi:hypothetical protein
MFLDFYVRNCKVCLYSVTVGDAVKKCSTSLAAQNWTPGSKLTDSKRRKKRYVFILIRNFVLAEVNLKLKIIFFPHYITMKTRIRSKCL